jgi:predicted metalloendopeptidase
MKLTPTTKSKKKITYSSKNKTVRALRSDLKKIQEIQKYREAIIGEQIGFTTFEDEYEASKNFTSGTMTTYKKTIKELSELINAHFAPPKYNPRTNFYEYINYAWLTNADKQYHNEYFVELDDFRLVQDKVYLQVINLVKIYINEHSDRKSKLVNNVYQSMLKLNEAAAEGHIQSTVKSLDGLIQEGNLWKLLATINKNEIVSWACPLVWKVAPDAKNSSIFRYNISSGQMSLYDVLLYFESEDTPKNMAYKKEVKKRFLQYLNKLFNKCLGPKHGLKAEDVLEVETTVINMFSCTSIKHESPEYYNVVKAKDALSKYGFNWEEFSKQLGFSETPEFFITGSLNYLKCCCEELTKNWQSAKWRTYWIYIYLRQIVRFHKSGREIYYDFYEKFVHGQDMMFPQEIYPIFGLSVCFNTLLTVEYVKQYKNQVVIDYVNTLAYDLKKVFMRKIKRNTWLSPSTKKAALKKFKYMQLLIGHPEELQDDLLLDYDNTDAWGNMLKITNARHNEFLKMNGEKVFSFPTFDWNAFKMNEKQAYIVNCFYIANENRIYIPLAYLQKPFVDLGERGIEYNLAQVGYALGHELSHALDTTGSKYDYKGDLKSWWTPRDRKIFNKKVQDVIKQYETFAKYDNVEFDAEVGTGEDMADISGIAICTEYLRDFNDHVQELIPMRAASFHKFFAQIAIQGRQRVKKKALAAELKINPHPLEVYRVNCSLARLMFFCKMYNIQPGDKMYWPGYDTIW